LQQQVDSVSQYLASHGMGPAAAGQAAYGYVYSRLQAQAHLLAFMDCFHVIGLVTLVSLPLLFLTRPFAGGGRSTGGH
jgi:DHA2 family multidrug resistance protein